MQSEITIIGAGIGGLSLAIALEQKGINFRLYEQSNSFDLNPEFFGQDHFDLVHFQGIEIALVIFYFVHAENLIPPFVRD